MPNFRLPARGLWSCEYRGLRITEPRFLPTPNHEDPGILRSLEKNPPAMLPFGCGENHALSPKEYAGGSRAGNFNGGALCLHCAQSLKGGDRVEFVVVQMAVTAVLLFGFAAEVLLSHFGAK